MSAAIPLGRGSEFDLIRSLLDRWGDLAVGVGDDAAVLDVPAGQRLVVSTDSSVENIHFRRQWLHARDIGFRATTAALSDLAAMAAAPLGIVAALSVPGGWLPELASLADGIGDAVRQAGTRIVGGDLTAAHELAICVTVFGSATRPLGRGGARPGDLLYVTGTLGGPLAALRAWESETEPGPQARSRFARPSARLREAQWLAQRGASAAVDISDGLAGDAGHMASASGVRLALELDRLPVVEGVSKADAARSGEEYELLVAAPAAFDTSGFQREFGIPLTAVGRASDGEPAVDATLAGRRVTPPSGFSHFR